VNKICVTILILLFNSQCDLLTKPPDPVKPVINYTAWSGWSGSAFISMKLDSDGLATNQHVYPELLLQLTHEEHNNILGHFENFTSLADSYATHICMDDNEFVISYSTTDISKTVYTTGCNLYHSDGGEGIDKLNDIVDVMNALVDTIYARQAPWIGLDLDISLNKDTYGAGEPIAIRYTIVNPTDRDRSLHFKGQDQVTFYIDRKNFSFYYRYPHQQDQDSGDATQIFLPPGETHEIVYIWDQSTNDGSENSDSLLVGYYTLVSRLLSGNLGEKVVRFEVVDKSVPLGGYVIPCGKYRICGDPDYMFALSIRNYTANSITLHFPYEEKIFVKLYDTNYSSAPLVYQSPMNLASSPASLTLEPGDTLAAEFYDSIVYEHTVPLDSLNISYYWGYAEIYLLISDFDFMRAAHLRF
jgi:hypothetical protein